VTPSEHSIALEGGGSVGALVYPAARAAGVTLVLGHGAGAGQRSDFMVAFAGALAERGLDVMTFDFPYMARGGGPPDRSAQLEACFRAAVASAPANPRLVIGGKSMGGRIASQVAAAGLAPLAGLVFLGYPLHPPGRPDALRVAHLPRVRRPMLFVQGSRDAFGTPDELRPHLARLQPPPELFPVEDGDHSLAVRRRSGRSQPEVFRAIQDHIASWAKALPESI
jgi:predicted alpha/beta-hydrolase family hydrolase